MLCLERRVAPVGITDWQRVAIGETRYGCSEQQKNGYGQNSNNLFHDVTPWQEWSDRVTIHRQLLR
jgi:hypothetical protein